MKLISKASRKKLGLDSSSFSPRAVKRNGEGYKKAVFPSLLAAMQALVNAPEDTSSCHLG